MEFTVKKTEFQKRLQTVARASTGKISNPIFHYTLLEVEGVRLRAIGAGDPGWIRAEMACVSSVQNFRILVNTKILLDILKVIPEQPIRIVAQERILFIYHSGGKFEIPFLDDIDAFPLLNNKEKEGVKLKMRCNTFFKGISSVMNLCYADAEGKPVLNSLYFELESGIINFVATDGGAMGVYSLDDNPSVGTKTANALLPKSAVDILSGIVMTDNTPITISIGKKYIEFTFFDYILYLRQIEGKYPPYRNVIRKESDKMLEVKTTELISALNRAKVLHDELYPLLTLSMTEKNLQLFYEKSGLLSCCEENISADLAGAQKFKIGVSLEKLTEIIKHIDSENCRMKFAGVNKAIFIEPVEKVEGETLLYLLMPYVIQ